MLQSVVLSTHGARWAVLCLAVLGCDSGTQPSAESPAKERPQQSVERLRVSPDFAFLSPVASQPAVASEWMPDLPVTVRIDELSGSGKVVRTLSTFSSRGGPGGERLRVHLPNQACDGDDNDADADAQGYYYVRWFAKDANLSPSAEYRVRVLVPENSRRTRELGYADLEVDTAANQFRFAGAGQYMPFIRGTTVRIKFRVGWRAVDKDRDGIFDWLDNCPTIANPAQTDTLKNGIGDACRCLDVKCPRRDACHAPGQCDPATGTCIEPALPNDTACRLSHANGACTDGTCNVKSCRPYYADCNGDPRDGCETSTATTENCGTCGNACQGVPGGQSVCRRGRCETRCGRTSADCDGDPSNGCETDTVEDPMRCGSCSTKCAENETCISGRCSKRQCGEGWADCDGVAENGCETDTLHDSMNCGSCGGRCPSSANSTMGCVAGVCRALSCDAGYGDCNSAPEDGCETDLREQPSHCGGCETACSMQGASAACENGTCQIASCNSGFADCDGLSVNGCEVALNFDSANCGACGRSCSVQNGSARCVEGTCRPASCASGYADCDALAENGCESQLSADPDNCGACGAKCPNGPSAIAICTEGSCATSCTPGYADCDGDPANGCEVALNGSCGACFGECSVPNALGECSDGHCQFSVCNVGYADCDGLVSNGCEVSLESDASHCGACSISCARPNATALCVSGRCATDSCNGGYGDCDGVAENGCEADLLNDASNCNSCGKACPSSSVCFSGQCICPEGACSLVNGECPDVHSDPANCGFCGDACLAGESCVNGGCVCPDDHWACGDRASGHYSCCPKANSECMTGTCHYFDLMNDDNNCGQIGRRCQAGSVCSEGVCVAPPDLQNDPHNCGSYGHECPEFSSCFEGMCVYRDPANCGGPGIICPDGATCWNGCWCAETLDFPCNNRCDINYMDDPDNCGMCDVICAPGMPCVNGVCAL